jgi:hypothetical protein
MEKKPASREKKPLSSEPVRGIDHELAKKAFGSIRFCDIMQVIRDSGVKGRVKIQDCARHFHNGKLKQGATAEKVSALALN